MSRKPLLWATGPITDLIVHPIVPLSILRFLLTSVFGGQTIYALVLSDATMIAA
jgi:hypothetical protein